MKAVTATELRANICNLLEEVLETGVPLEIKKGDRRLLTADRRIRAHCAQAVW